MPQICNKAICAGASQFLVPPRQRMATTAKNTAACLYRRQSESPELEKQAIRPSDSDIRKTFAGWRGAVAGVAKPHGLVCSSIHGVRRGHIPAPTKHYRSLTVLASYKLYIGISEPGLACLDKATNNML